MIAKFFAFVSLTHTKLVFSGHNRESISFSSHVTYFTALLPFGLLFFFLFVPINMRYTPLISFAILCGHAVSLVAPSVIITTTQIVQPRQNGFFCEHQGGPGDGNNAGNCYCTDSASTTTVAPATGAGNPCPWTAFPITSAAPATTPTPVSTITGHFTTTIKTEVHSCTAMEVSQSADLETSSCVGSSTVVSWLPHVTVMADVSSRQSVGAMAASTRSSALFTSVPSALDSLCPTPSPDGAATQCKGGQYDSVNITGLPYQADASNNYYLNHDGTLHVTTPGSNYTTAEIRKGMVDMLLQTIWQQASNATFCNFAPEHQGDPGPGQQLCSAPGLVNVLYMDLSLNDLDPAGYMNLNLNFDHPPEVPANEANELSSEKKKNACETLDTIGSTFLEFVFPEFLPAEIVGEDSISVACEVGIK